MPGSIDVVDLTEDDDTATGAPQPSTAPRDTPQSPAFRIDPALGGGQEVGLILPLVPNLNTNTRAHYRSVTRSRCFLHHISGTVIMHPLPTLPRPATALSPTPFTSHFHLAHYLHNRHSPSSVKRTNARSATRRYRQRAPAVARYRGKLMFRNVSNNISRALYQGLRDHILRWRMRLRLWRVLLTSVQAGAAMPKGAGEVKVLWSQAAAAAATMRFSEQAARGDGWWVCSSMRPRKRIA
ncbi:MAG: hypothetical protein Q9223_002735 [Gallowayella weberi]